MRKLRFAALMLILLVAVVFASDTLLRWLALSQLPLNLDFSLYRASAIQGMQFGWNHLYDVDAQRQVYDAQQRAYPSLGPMVWALNVYTPPVSWLAVPFTYVSVPIGYLIWSALIFASTAFASLILSPGGVLPKVVQLALVFCPYLVLLSLSEGQVTSFQIAAIAACWLLLKRGHDFWAGIALLPPVIKPQTLALVPFTLFAAGRINTFAAWVIATLATGFAILANIGLDGAIAYLHRLQYATAHLSEYLLGPWYILPAHFQTRTGRLAAEVLAGALAVWVAWRYRRVGPEIPIASGLIGSLLVSEYLHLNDMLTLFPACWLILRAQPRWWLWMLMFGGYLLTLLCTPTGPPHWGEVLLLFEITVLIVLAVIRLPQSSQPTVEWGTLSTHALPAVTATGSNVVRVAGSAG